MTKTKAAAGGAALTPREAAYFKELLQTIPVAPPEPLLTKYIEGRRIMPATSAIPGLWSWQPSPFLKEIVDCLSDTSPIQEISILKARKLGFTQGLAVNAAIYFLFENPTSVMYATASEDLAHDFSQLLLDPAIASMGLRPLLGIEYTNSKSRRSADRTERKETLAGGVLDIISHQSKMARRAKDIRVLIVDEVDAAPSELTSGEGRWLDVLKGHTMAQGDRRKIMMFGSPSTYQDSQTYVEYMRGDCRKFNVPCPFCGQSITLDLEDETNDGKSGLIDVVEGGEIVNAFYLCPKCGERISNSDKVIMYSEHPILKNGKKCKNIAVWKPTKKSDDVFLRSYYINALYAPIGAYSFLDIAKDRQRAKMDETPGRAIRRSFINIDCGLPYRDTGAVVKPSEARARCARYKKGEAPSNDIAFITVGIDIQAGQGTGQSNSSRIECVVLGHGYGYRTWVIDNKVFYGDTREPFSGAWAGLSQAMTNRDFFYQRPDSSLLMPSLMFFDAGNAAEGRADAVFRFCDRIFPLGMPIKGFGQVQTKRGERGDVPGNNFLKRYRIGTQSGGDHRFIEISTWYYKNELISSLMQGGVEKSGGIALPADMTQEDIEQMTGTERIIDGAYKDTRAHVEFLDCCVYALCARDYFLDSRVNELRTAAQQKGWTAAQTNLNINSRTVFEIMQGKIDEKALFAHNREEGE